MKPSVAASAPTAYDSLQAGGGRPGNGPEGSRLDELFSDPSHDPTERRVGFAGRRQISDDLIGRTLRVWQPRTSRRLTREDAEEIIRNAERVGRIILRWRIAEARGARQA